MDLVAISVDAVLYFRVSDPLLAVVGNDNYVEITLQKVSPKFGHIFSHGCPGPGSNQDLLGDKDLATAVGGQGRGKDIF